jgi:hypothetical protein
MWAHPLCILVCGGDFSQVTEHVRGLVDLNDGQYLHIPKELSLVSLFGEPCEGRLKDLVIEYEVDGSIGSLKMHVRHGYLATDMSVHAGHILHMQHCIPNSIPAAPVISPQIIVEKAEYGIIPEVQRV